MKDFFNNASVAGFLGAAFAFCFLVLWDLLKDWRTSKASLRQIGNELQRARRHAEGKLAAVRAARADLRAAQIRDVNLLRFSTDQMQEDVVKVWHKMSGDQQAAIDAITHRLEGTDAILGESEITVLSLRRSQAIRDEAKLDRTKELDLLANAYEDTIINLNILIEWIGFYAAGKFLEITPDKIQIDRYRDPPLFPDKPSASA